MEIIVYLVGVTLLGVVYQPVKTVLGDGVLFVSAVVGYLMLLRLIGSGLKRYSQARRGTSD